MKRAPVAQAHVCPSLRDATLQSAFVPLTPLLGRLSRHQGENKVVASIVMEVDHQGLIGMREMWLEQGGEKWDLAGKASTRENSDISSTKKQETETLFQSLSNYPCAGYLPCKVILIYKFHVHISYLFFLSL